MNWAQRFVAFIIAAPIGETVAQTSESTLAGIGAGILTFILASVGIDTVYRTRHWVGRGGHRGSGQSCPNCGQYIRRQSGDWLLRCKRCDWRVGVPGLRWFTHSVPSAQLRRSLGGGRVIILVLSLAVVTGGFVAPQASQDIFSEPDSENIDSMSDSGGQDDSEQGGENDDSAAPSDTDIEDTDDDGLPDSIEQAGETGDGYPLPDASPDQKDLYVHVYTSEGVEPLSAQEQRNLREIWGEMPVENPDGSEGIDLHIEQTVLSQEITADLTDEGLRELETSIYQDQLPAAAQCTVYTPVLIPADGNPSDIEISGRGSSPGYLSIVDGTATQQYDTSYSLRTAILTHELLHNIVGEFEDGGYHTDEGWLSTGNEHGTNFYLSEQTTEKLSEHGFAESEYFDQEVCSP